jgi:hypothetical protein
MTGALALERAGGGSLSIELRGEGPANNIVQRSSANASPPAYNTRKSRGTIAGPAVVNNGDQIGLIQFQGHDGSDFVNVAVVEANMRQASPGPGAMGGRLRLRANPAGSATVADLLTLDHTDGLQAFGAGNTVVDANRHLRLRSYTLASLPSASPAGQLIYCSDLGGGGGELVSDGAAWRRTSPGGLAEVVSDANLTLTTLADAPTIRHTGALSADRTITLSAANAYNGVRFTIVRTGGGAGLLLVGGLKSLGSNQWCAVEYDGAAWRLVGFGGL